MKQAPLLVAFVIVLVSYEETKRTTLVDWTPTEGIQEGFHWNGHLYVTDWATCHEECSIRGYPGDEDWSDGVTVACYGFQQEGDEKEPLMFGICCEPESEVILHPNGTVNCQSAKCEDKEYVE